MYEIGSVDKQVYNVYNARVNRQFCNMLYEMYSRCKVL